MKKKWTVYTGTFADCFYTMQFDNNLLEISELKSVFNPADKSAFFAVSENGRRMYVANEFREGKGGVAVFDVSDKENPIFLNEQSSGGQGPAHISLTNLYGKDYLLGSGYFDGDITIYPIDQQGMILPLSERICLQKGSNAHAIMSIPESNYILVTNTGHGEVYTYKLLPDGKLEHQHTFKENGFDAPRHMIFSDDGCYVYILTEKTNTLDVFEIDRETGKLCHLQQTSTLPDDFQEKSEASAIHMSPDKKYIYCSNRGHDSIVVYYVRKDHLVDKIGYVEEGIAWPREFAIDPEGKSMIVGNQLEKSLSIYRMNEKNGMPEYTGNKIKLEEGPICFAFL